MAGGVDCEGHSVSSTGGRRPVTASEHADTLVGDTAGEGPGCVSVSSESVHVLQARTAAGFLAGRIWRHERVARR